MRAFRCCRLAAALLLTTVPVQAVDAAPLEASVPLTGTVSDAVTGGPVAGAAVDVYSPSGALVQRTVTDADGHWSSAVPSGAYAVRVVDEAGPTGHVAQWFADASSLRDATLVRTGGAAAAVELQPGGAIAGMVTVPAGAVDGVLSVHPAGGDATVATVAVAGSSPAAYSVVGLPAGDYDVEFDGLQWFDHAPTQQSAMAVTVAAGAVTDGVDVDVVPSPTVSGAVVDDEGGDPVVGAVVTLTPVGPGVPVEAVTGADGGWSTAVVPGAYVVRVQAAGRVTEYLDHAVSAGAATPVQVDADVVLGVVGLAVAGSSITGTVTAVDGPTWACITATHRTTGEPYRACADDGAFSIAVPSGTFDVAVAGPSTHLAQLVQSVDAGADLPVVLQRGARLGGTVTDSLFDLPLTGIDVTFFREDVPGTWSAVASTTTDANGGYRSFGLPAGEYRVGFANPSGRYRSAFLDGAASVDASRSVVVVAGTDTNGLDAQLSLDVVPAPPTGVSGVPGDSSVTVTWSASTGATGYTVTASPAGRTCSTAGTSCVVPSLSNGTAYTFTVVAANAIAGSAPSAASAAVVPRSVPSAPLAPKVSAGDRSVTVAWAAPATGGAAITDYVVQWSSNAGSSWTTFVDGVRSSTGATVTGLVNGRSYVFRVAAVNVAGQGAMGVMSVVVVPRTKPSAPKASTVVARVKSVVVTWAAPANGGSKITDYVVQWSSNGGRTWVTFKDGVRASTGATVTGLLSGRSYVFRVAAKNIAGQGAFSPTSISVKAR